MRRAMLFLVAATAAVAWPLVAQASRTPPRAQTAKPDSARPAPADVQEKAATVATAPAWPVHADMNQLMRGVLYPSANVVFFAQAEDPAAVKPASDPGMATDPLASTFGGWRAIENAALALAESANLMLLPGRVCSTGVVAPTSHPDWVHWVEDVRKVSLQAYDAAKSKDQDRMIAVAAALTEACGGCHRRWRDRRPPAVRCK